MPWFVKLEAGIVEKAEFDRHVPAHKAYIQQLIERGHQAKTGYWGDVPGGMLLFWAESRTIAEEIVQADPLVVNQCVSYELHEWCIVGGDL